MRVQLIDGQFAWPIAGEELQKLQSQWLLAIGAINAEMLPERDWPRGKCLALSSSFWPMMITIKVNGIYFQ